MTMRETRSGLRDEAGDAHWPGGALCWCGERHQAGEAGVTLVPAPWDRSRNTETSYPAVGQ